MDRKAKLGLLAQMMVDRHGENAALLARRRIAECREDREAARVWFEVAAMIESLQEVVIGSEPLAGRRKH